MNAEAQALLSEIAEEYCAILGEKLTGIYVHGSLAFGCFRWAVSDIDFLVVVNRPLITEEKIRLLTVLLERTACAPEKGFEMSVVLAGNLRPFVYPTPFELHYSAMWTDECRKDPYAWCERPHGGDPDLAAHCMVTLMTGIRIMGEEIDDVFGEVPRDAYLDSILQDVACAEQDVTDNPVYVILNLCRVLAAVREGKVLSKADGGRWGIEHTDGCWHEVIRGALAAYEEEGKAGLDEAQCVAFASAMLEEIRRRIRG